MIEGATDREYYTDSFHVPVYYFISAEKKIELEEPYHALINAGDISCVYMKVRLMFDPPTSSAAIESMTRLTNEFEWRLNVAGDKNE